MYFVGCFFFVCAFQTFKFATGLKPCKVKYFSTLANQKLFKFPISLRILRTTVQSSGFNQLKHDGTEVRFIKELPICQISVVVVAVVVYTYPAVRQR